MFPPNLREFIAMNQLARPLKDFRDIDSEYMILIHAARLDLRKWSQPYLLVMEKELMS